MKLTDEELEVIRKRNVHHDSRCGGSQMVEDFDRLFHHIKAVEEELGENMEEVLSNSLKIKSLEIRDGKMDLELKSEIIPMICASMVRILQIESAPNYLTMTLKDAETHENFEWTIQRIAGETPTQQLIAARAKLEQEIQRADQAEIKVEELANEISVLENRREGWDGTGDEY